MKPIYFLLLVASLLTLNGCDQNDPQVSQPGRVTFSFKGPAAGTTGGRIKDQTTPAFVSYTLKKADGSVVSNKIELYEFNGSFVTQPQQTDAGHYQLEQFLILGTNNNVIYAAPVAGSEMADLVEHPLPLAFDITADEVAQVVPEVLAVNDHTPKDFGYLTFGFMVVEKLTFNITASIADPNPHEIIDYQMEIIAKDAPLGAIKWTSTLPLSRIDEINLPAKYGHYTFRAVKAGYLPHVQHFLKSDLPENGLLTFEFIPEGLEGFITKELSNGIKVYFPNLQYRCKAYARIDLPEGYALGYLSIDKAATTKGGLPVPAGAIAVQLKIMPGKSRVLFSDYAVNLFDNNRGFTVAKDLCSTWDLSVFNPPKTVDDINLTSFLYAETVRLSDNLPAGGFGSFYQLWKGKNN